MKLFSDLTLFKAMLPVLLLMTGYCLPVCHAAPPTEKVHHVMTSAKVRTMDPINILDTTTSGVAGNIYDTLYQYHYLKRPYQVIPSVAAALPTYSKDRLTLTIPLRKDVFFHDDPCFPNGKGRQVVAEDFIYAWKRIAYSKNANSWWLLDGRIKGLNEFRKAAATINPADMDFKQKVEGLKAVNPHTLQITLTKPAPTFLFVLTHLPTAVVPREAVATYGSSFARQPVGTGPYKLASWESGHSILLVRNQKYRSEYYPKEGAPGDKQRGLLADAGKPLPLLDRIAYSVIYDDTIYWTNFLTGKADAAGIPRDFFSSAITENYKLKNKFTDMGIHLTKFSEPSTFWVCFNMDDPVLGKNLPLRQGMNLAVDRKKYVSLFMNNRGTPAKGPIPPSLAYTNQALETPYATFNPKLARKKIKEAKQLHLKKFGTPMGKLTFSVGGTDSMSRQTALFYQKSFKSVGLEVELDPMPWPELMDMTRQKKSQIYMMGWVMDWPDTLNMMQLWYGPNESPGSNTTNYKNKKYDRLFEQARKLKPGEQRAALVHQMEQILMDDLPNIFVCYRSVYSLRHSWLLNFKPHAFSQNQMKYYNINPKQK